MERTNKQQLSLFDLTMIVIGLVIGLGIFRTASDSARASLTPTVFFTAWLVGGLIALCGALTYAEIGSRLPVTGGYYKIFAVAYHPSVAFAVNCIILVSNAASLAGVALIGSEYLAEAIFAQPPSDTTKAFIAMGSIGVFYVVNLLGLRMSATTQNLLMSVKIGMVVVLILAIFFPQIHAPVTVTTTAVPVDHSWTDLIQSFGAALVAVSFTYGGYQQTINFGGEVRNARYVLPRGILIGTLVIIALYLTVSWSYYKVIGFEELKNSRGIAAIVAERMFGPTGRYAFSLLLFLAVLAYVNVILLSNPRVMYAMSEDGILPKIFGKKDEKRDVLTVSLTTYALLSVVMIFFMETFDRILSFTMFLDCIGMAFSAATLFILRRRQKDSISGDTYRMRLYPWLPLLFIAAYGFVAYSIAINKPVTAITAVAVLAAFVIVYFIFRRSAKQQDGIPGSNL